MFPRSLQWRRLSALLALAFVYFVVFPEDMELVLSPLAKVLGLSAAVSPWLYVVLGAWIIAWAIVRVWGPRDSPV